MSNPGGLVPNPGIPLITVISNALRRRWPLALALGVVCGVFGILAVVTLRAPVFTAVSLVHVAGRKPSLVFETETPGSQADGREFRLAQEQLVKSPPVVMDAIKSPELAGTETLTRHLSPATWLARSLEVTCNAGTETMAVKLKGEDHRDIALIVDAVIRAYMDCVTEQEQALRNRRIADLARAYSEKEIAVRGKRMQLREMLIQSGLEVPGDSSSERQIAMTRLTEAHRELLRYGSTLEDLKGEIELRQEDSHSKAQPSISTGELRHLAKKDQKFAELSIEVDEIDTAIAQARVVTIPAAVARVEGPYLARREQLEQQMVARMAELRKGASEAKRLATLERIRTLQQEADLAERRVEQLEKAAEQWTKRLRKLNPSIGRPESVVEVEMLESEIKQLDGVLGAIARNREMELVELAAEDRVSVIQEAQVSSGQDRAMRYFLAGAVGFVAFILPVLGVIFWDTRQRLIGSPRELSATLGIDLLGAVPKPTDCDSHKAMPWPERSQHRMSFSDATDTITVRLLRETQPEEKRVIAICSTVGDEGRTVLAGQIARSIARSDRRTILVDGNLQQPTLHSVFNAPCLRGLSDMVTGSLDIADALHETSAPNMWFLPAGLWSQRVRAALANGRFETLLEELTALFDFVVIDGGPILAGIDNRYLCQHADMVVLSVERDVSRASNLHVARGVLESLGIRRPSAVVCGATESEQYDLSTPMA